MPPPLLAPSPSPAEYARLASTLPPLLLNFLRRHPPGTYSQTTTPALPLDSSTTSGPSPSQPAIPSSVLTSLTTARQSSNPFAPWRNPLTSKWRPPIYSLRRQAELYKLAGQHGVTSLLPRDSPRNPVTKLARREEAGLRVRGTGAGQRVKGKAWERGLRGKLEAREKAMEGMGAMIKEWKQKGHGRGWKKWPK